MATPRPKSDAQPQPNRAAVPSGRAGWCGYRRLPSGCSRRDSDTLITAGRKSHRRRGHRACRGGKPKVLEVVDSVLRRRNHTHAEGGARPQALRGAAQGTSQERTRAGGANSGASSEAEPRGANVEHSASGSATAGAGVTASRGRSADASVGPTRARRLEQARAQVAARRGRGARADRGRAALRESAECTGVSPPERDKAVDATDKARADLDDARRANRPAPISMRKRRGQRWRRKHARLRARRTAPMRSRRTGPGDQLAAQIAQERRVHQSTRCSCRKRSGMRRTPGVLRERSSRAT